MKKRRGFTLFELLTVLALLGLLLGLLLPAVQKVREAASRVQSANNLKQYGLACHNYHDTYGSFPPGVDSNNFSAVAHLLPFIEQNNLFQQIDFNKPISDNTNSAVAGTVMKICLNPQDPIENVRKDRGATNYLFSAGTKPSLEENDGIFFTNSKIKFAQITDGTSNTFMIGETLKGDGGDKAVDVKRQYVLLKDKDALKNLKDESGVQDWKDGKNISGDRCASWMDGRFLQGTFTGTRGINDERPDVSCDYAGGLSGLRTLTDGVNVAFCDGSVHYVKKGIKFDVLKLLISRDDGQVIPNSDYF
jgi:prepilin-type N-terminal cleavage/methylation domain-containing protein/prepilin-type processing-associated H-X9-DG protein